MATNGALSIDDIVAAPRGSTYLAQESPARMAELFNVITVPIAHEEGPLRGFVVTEPTAASSDVPMQVFNATPFSMVSVVLNTTPLMGTPCAGLTAGGQMTALSGSLQANSSNPIKVSFDGGGWSANFYAPGGPPRQVTLLCFWNGCVLLDYNGLMRTIMW